MRFTQHLRQLDGLFDRPIAHRGLHDINNRLVENTESAFAAAIVGNFAIECDIQLSADGEAMVFHDETLDRVMQTSGAVHKLSAAELRRVEYRHSADRMQTLAELLDQVGGNVPLVIEIKSHWDGDPALTERAMQVCKSYAGQIALMSFDPQIVSLLAYGAPSCIRGIVADRVYDPYYEGISIARRVEMRSLSHMPQSRPHFISFDNNSLPFAPVQYLRAEGMPVITWTITSKEQASRARRYSDQITFENFRPE
jgi:glycerophosphoryl diester phosphodiesterase